MKACKILLLLSLMLFCRAAFAQAINSSLTVRIEGGNYLVSGVVPTDYVKNEVAGIIKTRLGDGADFSRVVVAPGAGLFPAGWQAELDKSLLKIKSWKSGVFIFSNVKSEARPGYPPLPAEIAGARFRLSDGRTVSLDDYRNKVVVLFFNEVWNLPGNQQAEELNEFYRQISARSVEIISLSVETAAEERSAYRSLYQRLGIRYRFGWADGRRLVDFSKISRVNAIPQTFIILNGRLHGIFVGNAPKVMKTLKATILKTLDENNL